MPSSKFPLITRPRPQLLPAETDLYPLLWDLFAEIGHNRRVCQAAIHGQVPPLILKETKREVEEFLLLLELEYRRNQVWHLLDQLNLLEIEAIRDFCRLLRGQDLRGSSIH